jgi:cold shock CspA family protein
MSGRLHGVVVRQISDKGYFFIRADGHNSLRDFYCSLSGMSDGLHSLNKGERVHFVEMLGDRGAKAGDVQLEREVPRESAITDRSSSKLGRSH